MSLILRPSALWWFYKCLAEPPSLEKWEAVLSSDSSYVYADNYNQGGIRGYLAGLVDATLIVSATVHARLRADSPFPGGVELGLAINGSLDTDFVHPTITWQWYSYTKLFTTAKRLDKVRPWCMPYGYTGHSAALAQIDECYMEYVLKLVPRYDSGKRHRRSR